MTTKVIQCGNQLVAIREFRNFMNMEIVEHESFSYGPPSYSVCIRTGDEDGLQGVYIPYKGEDEEVAKATYKEWVHKLKTLGIIKQVNL